MSIGNTQDSSVTTVQHGYSRFGSAGFDVVSAGRRPVHLERFRGRAVRGEPVRARVPIVRRTGLP